MARKNSQYFNPIVIFVVYALPFSQSARFMMTKGVSLHVGVVLKEFFSELICTNLSLNWKIIIWDLNQNEWGKTGPLCFVGSWKFPNEQKQGLK